MGLAAEQQVRNLSRESHPGMRVVCVSEDPDFIHELQDRLDAHGIHVIGCLGPTHSSCPLMCGNHCRLTKPGDFVLVDSPPSGSFVHYWQEVQVGPYAGYLQRDQPEAFVIVCGAPVGPSGPTGEVAHVSDREEAIELLRWLALTRSADDRSAEPAALTTQSATPTTTIRRTG